MIGTLTESERGAILDDEIRRYVARGYRVQARTATTAQLIRPKSFSVAAAIFWALFLLVGLIIYLLIYAAQKDEALYLSVDERGNVVRQGSGGTASDQACRACGYENRRARQACKRCKAPL